MTWTLSSPKPFNRTHCSIDLIKEKQFKPLKVYNINAIRREISPLLKSGGHARGFNFWSKNWSFELHNNVRQLLLGGEVGSSSLSPSCPGYWRVFIMEINF